MTLRMDPRALLGPDFGDARDVATIEDILAELAEADEPARPVGVATFH